MDLRQAEIDNIEFLVSIFQAEKGKIDAYDLPMIIRGLDLNASLAHFEKYGWQQKRGVKLIDVDELKTIYCTMRKEKKDYGCYEDFVECLKLYDKEENGKMALSDLSHSLLSLGEKLADHEVDAVFEDCLPEEDDDGMIEYDIFLRKMCDRPEKK